MLFTTSALTANFSREVSYTTMQIVQLLKLAGASLPPTIENLQDVTELSNILINNPDGNLELLGSSTSNIIALAKDLEEMGVTSLESFITKTLKISADGSMDIRSNLEALTEEQDEIVLPLLDLGLSRVHVKNLFKSKFEAFVAAKEVQFHLHSNKASAMVD